ncbi:single-stranded DNA-binding protein [Wood mouse herpesvirus]|uniref:Single-stranded DNA-binding protein n=1 Tax=Wood mouse herpesvirus TaxID=432370 RepID=D0U1J8_9GAMA|nr:single-stranded DNA-binding protein [Wood mouse herpesvirus]ACY41084.1 single-stranded DNA-binding protein [Wood mouse herpesvirus]
METTNVCTQAPLGPAGYIYYQLVDDFPLEEASLLSTNFTTAKACFLPLLTGLTVEPGFNFNVKAPCQKIMFESLTVKPTKYFNQAIVFHNSNKIPPIFHGSGLEQLCEATRQMFGFSSFKPDTTKGPWKGSAHLPQQPEKYIGWVVVAESFKERLICGELALLSALEPMKTVTINNKPCFKIPLHDTRFLSTDIPLPFYDENISKIMYESYYTNLAQAVRIRDVSGLIEVLQERALTEQYKTAKLASLKTYPAENCSAGNLEYAVIDAAVSELAISHGLAFLEAPQEESPILNYLQWPMFAEDSTPERRIKALQEWNAKMAIHVHAQILSANSVLYVTKIGQSPGKTAGGKQDDNFLNRYYMQHGLGHLNVQTRDENNTVVFPGVPDSCMNGSTYTVYHLAYAASMSPHILARVCYYLQMCQNQRLACTPQSTTVPAYVTTAANTSMCDLCGGDLPAVCLHTLFFRLRDRFPQVLTPQKRDPYVVTGIAGPHNDMEILGNFGSFKEKDDDQENGQKYSYWQLNANLTERLEEIGVTVSTQACQLITDVDSFLALFKKIDAVVDEEAIRFNEGLVRNSVNFKESVKSIAHVLQLQCNTNWLPPCPIIQNLFTRSFFTILQDMSFPLCVTHHTENPLNYGTVSTWMSNHFQTLWSNFKSIWFDKGLLTCSDMRVVHNETTSDMENLAADIPKQRCSIRLSRAQIFAPKVLKIKNRIIFSNSSSTESLSANFIKAGKAENPITSGPYIHFLTQLHKQLFPTTKTGAYYIWQTFMSSKKLPQAGSTNAKKLSEFISYLMTNSVAHDEVNVLDYIPTTLMAYAKQRLNNAILRLCGQTQFYATTMNFLQPTILSMPSLDYPHVAGPVPVKDLTTYMDITRDKSATVIQSSCREDPAAVCKMRPIVTIPMMVNKYSGSNGNNSIFQSGNMGYFMGRGVDRKLLPDIPRMRKHVNTSMRRRYAFATPMTESLLTQPGKSAARTFQLEKTRKVIHDIICSGNGEPENLVLGLVKCLGQECATLTSDDVEFYLGEHAFMMNDVMEVLETLRGSGCTFSEESVQTLLPNPSPGTSESFVEVTDNIITSLPEMSVTQFTTAPPKRRRIATFEDIDL